VIGAGFIGLEMAENLVGQGLGVTIVEATLRSYLRSTLNSRCWCATNW